MRVCDRCGEKAVDEIILKSDDMRTDVCGGCREIVLQALRSDEPPKRRGRPPKNSGKPE